MSHDYLGNPVTGDRDATLAGIDDFVGGFLGYEERMLNILAAADADPGSCLANAYAGWLWMFLEAPEAPARAATYLERAERTAPLANRREQLATEVLGAWCADDVVKAARLADEILTREPRDLAALKLHQYFDFNRGLCPEMLRVALASLPHAGDIPQLHGMLAFAYEQCHLLGEAEAAARTALRMQPREPWAQHALAHVMLTQGRILEGIGFLESIASTWTGLTSFMYTHNWWHLAVFYISEGRFADALAIYDQHCWARDRTYSQDQIGAVSLLARLELAGAGVDGRWQALGEYLAARGGDTVQPFLTMQYLYGLARAERPEADALLSAVRRHAGAAPEALREAWADVALPACEGLVAYVRGDYRTARRRLGPTLGRMLEIGGSHAQRDLFAQIYVDSLLKDGQRIAAQQLLEQRRAFEPDGVPLNRALARVYADLGLPAKSARAAERARRPRR
ncbi:MAG TPA: tetratricopeptide repeat protein [Steroidobacteraceae bacterium]|nr:tetratricopeptide repeat protein [Steroidobacteraceae bacterium]